MLEFGNIDVCGLHSLEERALISWQALGLYTIMSRLLDLCSVPEKHSTSNGTNVSCNSSGMVLAQGPTHPTQMTR